MLRVANVIFAGQQAQMRIMRGAVAPIKSIGFGAVPRCMFASTSGPTSSISIGEVEERVFKVLRATEKCKQDKLSKTVTFEELGFDSLDAVALVVSMEEEFGVDIPN